MKETIILIIYVFALLRVVYVALVGLGLFVGSLISLFRYGFRISAIFASLFILLVSQIENVFWLFVIMLMRKYL